MDKQLSLMTEGQLFGQNNTEIEELVLGCFVNFPDSYYQYADQVSINEFSEIGNRYIYMAIKEVAKVSKIDIATVTDKIIQKKYEEIVNSTNEFSLNKKLQYVCELIDDDSHLKEHIKLLNEYAKRRALIMMSKNINEQCNDMVAPDRVLQEISRSIVNIQEMGEVEDFNKNKSIDNLIEQIASRKPVPMIESGIVPLDEFMRGWEYGELIILAGAASMGKTALALEVFKNSIFNDLNPVYFSLEMTHDSLIKRMLANESEIEIGRLRSMDIDDHEILKIRSASHKLKQHDFWIDERSRHINRICNQIRKYVIRYKSKIVFLDYLQLSEAKLGSKGNRQEEISKISRALKEVATELKIVVIALSQINRSVMQRQNKRPVLSDLRESGSIEQDADMVCFVYRPAYYDIEQAQNSLSENAEIIIAKGRNTGVGKVDVTYISKYTKFKHDYIKPYYEQTPESSPENMYTDGIREARSESDHQELFQSDPQTGTEKPRSQDTLPWEHSDEEEV